MGCSIFVCLCSYFSCVLFCEVDDLKKLVRAVVPYHIHIPDYVNCNIPNKTVHGYVQPAEFGRNLMYVKGYIEGSTETLQPRIVNPCSKFMVSDLNVSLRFREHQVVLTQEELVEEVEV